MDIELLRRIRAHELELVMPYFSPGQRVLEIGAGAGWQARAIAERGMEVVAIDLPAGLYDEVRVHPVEAYDGRHIPLPDASVDVAFSSNVLEHVPHVVELQSEIARVLKPDGYAVHVVPTSTFRLWALVAHYPFALRWLFARLTGRADPAVAGGPTAGDGGAPAPGGGGGVRRLLHNLVPYRHGETGTALGELWYFSALRWVKLFRDAGWTVEEVRPNRMYYSGYYALSPLLGIGARRALSRVLGSSCKIYKIRPPRA